LNPNYLERVEAGRLHLRNFEGKSFFYDTGSVGKHEGEFLKTINLS